MLEPREIDLINEAMHTANGSVSKAAKSLGITASKLKDYIRYNKTHFVRWNNDAEPPKDTDLITRPSPPPPRDPDAFSQDEIDLAKQISIEDAKVRAGLINLNLNEEELAEALSLEKFHRECFEATIHIAGSGVTKSSIEVRVLMKKIQERINSVQEQINARTQDMDATRQAWTAEEKSLLSAYGDFLGRLSHIYELSMRGAYIAALIRRNNRPSKMTKPGFAQAVEVPNT